MTTISGIGIGLRSEHFPLFLSPNRPKIAWLEILADHFIFSRGLLEKKLEAITEHYPSVLHCVGMGLGDTAPLNIEYLQEIKRLSNSMDTAWVSDHLCWSSLQGQHSHDLLPLPFTQDIINHVAARIQHVQEFLKKPLLIENISRYLTPPGDLSEAMVTNEIAKKSGCGLLLDINNVYVTCQNEGSNAKAFLDAIDPMHVKQAHLGGYTQTEKKLIDTHGERIHEPVWALYDYFLKRFGPIPTCIEWDHDVPEWIVMEEEIVRAALVLEKSIHPKERGKPIILRRCEASSRRTSQTLPFETALRASSWQTGFTLNKNDQIQGWQQQLWQSLSSDTPGDIQIHRHNIQSQRLSSLQKTFPACLHYLTESRFNFLALEFIKKNSSTSPNIAASGKPFPNFLRTHFTYAEVPEIADLADYEWVWHTTFHGNSRHSRKIKTLKNINENSTISLNAHLLKSNYPVFLLWQYAQPEYQGTCEQLNAGNYYYALQQIQGTIVTHELKEPFYAALALLDKPRSIDDWVSLCESISNFEAESVASLASCGLISVESS